MNSDSRGLWGLNS